MEIKEFVKTVIVDIVAGLVEASEQLDNMDCDAVINPRLNDYGEKSQSPNSGKEKVQNIEMSIALTVSDSKDKGGKAGLNIAGISAEMNGKGTINNSSVSTVKFTVPIAFPYGEW